MLHGIAENTLYSEAESARIERICKAKGFTLFRDLGIDEREQDRLLFVATLPLT